MTNFARLNNELKEILTNKNDMQMYTIDPPSNDLTNLTAHIIGQEDTPYDGYRFKLSIQIPKNYPYTAPSFKFITPIYHPNISESGDICLDILKNQWTPILNIKSTLISIISLLSDPNPNDPLRSEAANLYKTDKKKYERTVRDQLKKYAIPIPKAAQPKTTVSVTVAEKPTSVSIKGKKAQRNQSPSSDEEEDDNEEEDEDEEEDDDESTEEDSSDSPMEKKKGKKPTKPAKSFKRK